MSQAIALLISLVIELTIGVFLRFGISVRDERTWFTCGLLSATCLTHPIGWAIMSMKIGPQDVLLKLLMVEALIVANEGIMFRKIFPISWPRAFFNSVVLNFSSLTIGLLSVKIYEFVLRQF